jgi:hypothetical protein
MYDNSYNAIFWMRSPEGPLGPQGLKGDQGEVGALGTKGDVGAKLEPMVKIWQCSIIWLDEINLLGKPPNIYIQCPEGEPYETYVSPSSTQKCQCHLRDAIDNAGIYVYYRTLEREYMQQTPSTNLWRVFMVEVFRWKRRIL